jgi:hypothetical protein
VPSTKCHGTRQMDTSSKSCHVGVTNVEDLPQEFPPLVSFPSSVPPEILTIYAMREVSGPRGGGAGE